MVEPLKKPELQIVEEEVVEVHPARTPGDQAFAALRLAFTVIPIVAGVDKFFDVTTGWDNYVAPSVYGTLHLSAHGFMQVAGVIEVIAGIGIAIAPRIFGNVVCAWLIGVVINLIMLGNYYDVALRDLGLAVGAFALGRLASQYPSVPRRRLQALQ